MVTDLRCAENILHLYAFINFTFSIKSFVFSLIWFELSCVIGSIFVFLLAIFIVFNVYARNPLLIKILFAILLLFSSLTLVSLIACIFTNINFGLTEYNWFAQLVGVVTFAMEAFVVFNYHQLLTGSLGGAAEA